MARLPFSGYSNQGGRESNEDTARIVGSGRSLCAVLADGLGGHGRGDEASRAAVGVICDGWTPQISRDQLAQLVEDANQLVLSIQEPTCKMKTTLAVLSITDNEVTWAYVGDSRIYHFEDGGIVWQSTDHSASQVAVLLGQIDASEIRFHEDRGRLYKALGQEVGVKPDMGTFDPTPAWHVFLLCSDGFWEYVTEAEMEATLHETMTSGLPEEKQPSDWLRRMRVIRKGRAPSDSDNNSAIAIWLDLRERR